MNDDLFAPKTIERVNELDNSQRASWCRCYAFVVLRDDPRMVVDLITRVAGRLNFLLAHMALNWYHIP